MQDDICLLEMRAIQQNRMQLAITIILKSVTFNYYTCIIIAYCHHFGLQR